MRSVGAVAALHAAGLGVVGLAELLAVLEGKSWGAGGEDGVRGPFAALSSSLSRGRDGLGLGGLVVIRSAWRGLQRSFLHRWRDRMVCPMSIAPAV